MRDDIAKKLCERPRVGGSYENTHRKERQKAKNAPNLDSLPRKESMKKRHRFDRKQLNEFFPPLLGFLRKNVGRPWDKVFSEVAAKVKLDSAVQKHIMDHLRNDFVEEKPRFNEDGTPYRYGHLGNFPEFYVDRHGLLKQQGRAKNTRPRSAPREGRKRINRLEEYRRINGVWYHVRYRNISKEDEAVYDVIYHRFVDAAWLSRQYWSLDADKQHGPAEMDTPSRTRAGYWWIHRVCVSKRQLPKKEIKANNLNQVR